ncbi:MAG TPA: L-threonylcarbamoyladenylate synthase [Spirochaetia bacterium]|nr:L-threonylcarbamoyladenylate synthase [Spirochaetales bacterium]HRY78999.1 L-threonylcarbamoyladenylate synthase [Spirochaetia bacterium]HRZ88137.1 L-threonylcarbamoyladenylate synthase [Spirochaetia bacterium]
MPVEIIATSDADLRRAAEILASGGLVAFPTETVYGLGGDAWNTRALARIFEAKRRPAFDPLIVHIAALAALDDVADLGALVPEARRAACDLMEEFWPGPLTLILPKRPRVPDLATSGLPTVAVRLPNHPVARALIELSTGAVAAPSANPFGYLSPTRAEHVAAQLGDRVDLIVDGGRCPVGVESTVVDVTGPAPRVLRPGGLSLERLRTVAPGIEVLDRTDPAPKAPGQLANHYAPRRALRLAPAGGLSAARPKGRAAALVFDAESRRRLEESAARFAEIRVLSEAGDPVEAAANLFDLLHDLDSGDCEELWAERVPEAGLGAAVNDRLYKASKKT